MDLRESLQRTFGDAFTIERELGGGGMSRVFVARENSLNRQVVVKVLPEGMGEQVSADRFKREIGIAARLQQAHLVPLLSAGEVDGVPFFVMPYVDGETLRDRIARQGELPLHEAVRILREVASALAYSHSHGVVHRDIKPENILLSGGAAMVTDFGVAKAISESQTLGGTGITEVGMALGTPAYMAPEQVSADPQVDYRADVYSWGVVAYELLTGQPPFTGRPLQALLAAHVTEVPEHITRRRASVPAALAQLVMRCLEKRPADRPQNADELVRSLDAIGATISGPASHEASGRIARRAILRAALVLGVLAIGGAAYWKMRPAPATQGIQSIAVVPVTLSAADSSDYFADGVIETLIASLAKVPSLEVRPSASSLALRGKRLTDAEIGRMLNVASILHVSVRRAAPMMRITVDLSRVSDGKVLWTDQHERPLTEVFAVQDSIARRTASALAIHLAAHDRARVGSFGTQNLAAYDYYLKGRHAMLRYDEPSFRAAIALFDSALVIDPRYAQAHSAIAQCWLALSDDWVAPREGYPKAEAAAKRALEIDSTNGAARGLLAMASVTLRRDYARSLAEGERALRNDSLQSTSIFPYAGVLFFSGHTDSSLALLRRARALDPTDPLGHIAAGWTDFYSGRLDAAIADFRAALALMPGLPPAQNGLAETLLMQGRPAEALEALKGGEGQANAHRSTLARTLAALGRVDEAKKVTASLVADASKRYVSGDYIAAAYLALGNKNEALRWIERANDDRSQWILPARTDPRWASLRNEPRFKAVVAQIGAP
jgi:eukaryotic-like serine/threonine-protein kinase